MIIKNIIDIEGASLAILANEFVRLNLSANNSTAEILQTLLHATKLFNEQMLVDIDEKVHKSLKGRRYLIVMDDIWSTNSWDVVRHIFPDDKNGSRIMLTTRLSDVASYASSGGPVHEMKFLDENLSWNLLKQKVFTEAQDCPPELVQVGKEIARGCGGLPLAVVLVAGVLSTMVKTRASWEKIAGDLNAVLIDEQFDKILSLSYKLLPHHLRPCFLFMAGFPEDQNINVSRLVKLWVAEGFLRHRNGNNSLEEEAKGYLEDLVKRSLVLITTRKTNGDIKSCRLHDLVRDMCIRNAQEEKFLITDGYALSASRAFFDTYIERTRNERRISVGNCGLLKFGEYLSIHTILCLQPKVDIFSLDFVVSFSLLRVLDVIPVFCKFLPPQLFELFHLRYLSLGLTIKIPASISNLVNLQTLILRSRRREYHSFLSMPHLRHLVVQNCVLPYPILSQGLSALPLENLHTLSLESCFTWGSEAILKMIPNLKKLAIMCSTYGCHCTHNLANLHQLEKLKISRKQSWQEPYLLAFPLTVKKLTLVGGRLPWKDMTIVGLLPNLEVLKLREFACDGDTWETSDGGFPKLKYLLIENSNLRYWITESDHFPTLKCLILRDCPRLNHIPDEIGDIQTVELIEVDEKNQSLAKSAKQIQEEQLSYGNDALRVHCIHFMQGPKISAFIKNKIESWLDDSKIREDVLRCMALLPGLRYFWPLYSRRDRSIILIRSALVVLPFRVLSIVPYVYLTTAASILPYVCLTIGRLVAHSIMVFADVVSFYSGCRDLAFCMYCNILILHFLLHGLD